MTYRDLATELLQELGVVGQGDTPSAADAVFALGKINRVIDNWNADQAAIYSDQFLSLTLTPNLQPHTIGPTGATWTVSQRPVSIESVVLVVGTVTYQLTPHLAPWWNGLPYPTLATTLPSDFYYDATWPNGSLYLWPIPTAAYDLSVLVRTVLADVTLDTSVSLPPGYTDAIMLTAAEDCLTAFSVPPDVRAGIASRATKARARIFSNNLITPPLDTRDVGIPGARGWFNWRTGLVQ